jgi:transcriptional regulator with XRE-family HTH domain
MSQRELAAVADTSGPTVAAYESRTKSPNSQTLVRLLGAVGAEIQIVPSRSRNERFVDELCEVVAARVSREPALLEDARSVLASSRSQYASEWTRIVAAGPPTVVAVLTSRAPDVRPLKASHPFRALGLVTEMERQRALERARAT